MANSGSSLTSDEEGVAGKHSTIVAVLKEIAYAVLSVAWCMECCDLDVLANVEGLLVCWRRVHECTVLAANDWHIVFCVLLRSACCN